MDVFFTFPFALIVDPGVAVGSVGLFLVLRKAPVPLSFLRILAVATLAWVTLLQCLDYAVSYLFAGI